MSQHAAGILLVVALSLLLIYAAACLVWSNRTRTHVELLRTLERMTACEQEWAPGLLMREHHTWYFQRRLSGPAFYKAMADLERDGHVVSCDMETQWGTRQRHFKLK